MKAGARRIRAAGIELHVEIEGEGPPVVVLHGFTGSTRTMAGVSSALRDSWRTLRIDLLGHGDSEAPRAEAPYTLACCVEQLDAVLTALGVPDAHWLGYSMGGRVALACAVHHPERVRSVLLVGARAGIADAEARATRVREDRALADRIERRGVPAFVDAWLAQPLFASQARLGAAAIAAARAQRLDNRAHGLAGSLRGLGAGAQPPLHARLGELTRPVGLIVGEEDFRFRGEAEALAALLPHAELHLVPGAGHAAHVENPTAFAVLARSFLARADAHEPGDVHPAARPAPDNPVEEERA